MNLKRVKIGDRWVGEGEPVFIIAEAGVNHNGNLEMAKRLIEVAAEAGADAIKFQTFKTDRVITRGAAKASYQEGPVAETQYEMVKRLELTKDDFLALRDYTKGKEILFISTPFDEESANFLEGLEVPAFKIGSGDLTNLPLLKHIANKRLPIILSTGMSTLEEVKEAVQTISAVGNPDLILLHCTSAYPAAFEDANLKAMITLREEFQLPVGYSDHTLGITIPTAAVALGATVIEKHLTLDKSLPGPDHKASLEPDKLKDMVEGVRSVEKALGSPIKGPTDSEKEMIKLSRKSIVAKTNISKGTEIKKEMLCVKRPGTGIAPKHLESLIGRIAKVDIEQDEVITGDSLQ